MINAMPLVFVCNSSCDIHNVLAVSQKPIIISNTLSLDFFMYISINDIIIVGIANNKDNSPKPRNHKQSLINHNGMCDASNLFPICYKYF